MNDQSPEIPHQPFKYNETVQDETLIRAKELMEEYLDIAGLVHCTTYASPVNPDTVTTDSAGSRLLPGVSPIQLVEVNRTLSAVLTFDDVLAGNYEVFTGTQTMDRLSVESFAFLQELSNRCARPGPQREAVRSHLAINDNGKRDDWMRAATEIIGHPISDHDKVLQIVLTHRPEMSPTYTALPPESRQIILDCLEAGVNFGQIFQGEASVGSLRGLTALKQRPELLQHAVMEWVYDVAGARGHESQRGSLVVTEGFTTNAQMLIEALDSVGADTPSERIPADIYNAYLRKRAEALDLPYESNEDVTIARIACMAGIKTTEDAAVVDEAIRQALGISSRTILAQKLGSLNSEDPVIYYSPKIINNLINILREREDPDALHNGIVIGAGTLAQILSVHARQTALGAERMEQIMVLQIARLCGTTPEALVQGRIELIGTREDAMAGMKPEHDVDLSALKRMESLEELPGETFVAIGIGGGSDIVTAEVLAETAEAEGGKKCLGAISIRTATDYSSGGQRELLDFHENLGDGVYVAGPQSKMSKGRYHEDLVAATGRSTIVIMKDASVQFDLQLDKALRYLSSNQPIGTIIGVDTGGDAITPVGMASPSEPAIGENQDRTTLLALSRIGPALASNILVGIVGLGVDSPHGAGAMLQQAQSQYFLPSKSISREIIQRYASMGLPSDSPTRFAKTLPAFVKALEGHRGLVEVSLPSEVLLSQANPWNPFTYVDEVSTALFFTRLDAHLAVVNQ
jgi:hypothetical protein